MEGTIDGRELVVFESTYVIFTGQVVIPVQHTIYVAEAPDWPPTRISPRNWLARLAMSLGWGSGLMLENPEFNTRFKVTAVNDDFAIVLLSLQCRSSS